MYLPVLRKLNLLFKHLPVLEADIAFQTPACHKEADFSFSNTCLSLKEADIAFKTPVLR